jgi:D-tyrosyl-tRNA(Tyr) deacylase
MKAVIQRVKKTSLFVDKKLISEIEKGLAVYLGIKINDTEKEADYIVKKISGMRIFDDSNGKMNLSVKDINGEILLISQFTLYGDCTSGNRPSFIEAERPEKAEKLYKYIAKKLCENNIIVKTGVFGADMKITQLNDGPVTIILESR